VRVTGGLMTTRDWETRLRASAGRFSPGRRRWTRFLQSLPLDPERLALPLKSPGDRDFIICGCPRTGTSLLAAALFQPPASVTVMEPWDGMRLAPADLFASLRKEIESTRQLARGRLDVDALYQGGKVRWRPEGGPVPLPAVDADFALGVKWPGYWRYLGLLPRTKFLVCLRHPLEVISSFKVAGGRVAQGLQYDTAFNARLNSELKLATRDMAERRVLLFDYVHERLLPRLNDPNVFVVRYERWFDEPGHLLGELSEFLGCPLDDTRVVVKRSETTDVLDRDERRMIAATCRTAEPLGYKLDQAS